MSVGTVGYRWDVVYSVTGYFRNIWATCDTGDPLNIHSEVPVYINSTGLLRSIAALFVVFGMLPGVPRLSAFL